MTSVEIRLRGENLPKLDLSSNSDPFVIVRANIDDKWVELGRTETIKDSPNPAFIKAFIVPYHFEEKQPLEFQVLDADKGGEHDEVGTVSIALGQLVSVSEGGVARLKIEAPAAGKGAGRKDSGTLVCVLDVVQSFKPAVDADGDEKDAAELAKAENAAELAFLRDVASRVGVPLDYLANGSTKYRPAARQTPLGWYRAQPYAGSTELARQTRRASVALQTRAAHLSKSIRRARS